ncbi:MAG TPA: bacterial transcriptional activator domain-containing protein [Gemmatimonadales bacterium]
MNRTPASRSDSPDPEAGPTARLSILGTTDLRASDGRAVQPGAVQPKRLVLLAYLALAPAPGYVRRDTLIALFWPELATEQARHALRQSLHYLRSGLGREVIRARGDTEIAIDPAHLWCDARAFEARVAAHDPAGAVALYHGELLDGVFVADAAPELEQWLDAERLRFRRSAASASAELSANADAAGDPGTAIAWARRAASLDPDDERILRVLVELLDRHGDRAGALRAYAAFEQRLREEYDTAPSAQTRALRARLSQDVPQPAVPVIPQSAGPVTPEPATPLPSTSPAGDQATRTTGPRRSLALAAIGVVAIAALAIAFIAGGRRAPASGRELLAVGIISIDSSGATALDPNVLTLRSLITADLSQLDGIAVLSEGRLYEMVARARGSMDARDHVLDAARRSGATELLDGVLRVRPGLYRLELQRVELASGTVRGALVIEGSRIGDVVAQATSRIADAFRLAPPARSLGALTSQSPLARRSYELGVRAMYAGDRTAALRHFSAALEVDPNFFAAAYYALAATSLAGLGETLRRQVESAAAAADSAPERERLQIRTLWASLSNDPRTLAYAESLASRYPAEPEGRYHLGYALVHAGDFPSAIDQLRAAIAADSALLASALSGEAPCRACLAMQLVAQTYIFMDSMDAAHRWIDAWSAAGGNPTNVFGFRAVAHDLSGNRAAALAVLDSMPATARAEFAPDFLIESAIRAGEFEEAARRIAGHLASDDSHERRIGLWWDVIYHHTRGRLREAAAAADRFCAASTSPPDDCAQIRASALVSVGRFDEAASGLVRRLSLPESDAPGAVGLHARRRTWLLTHLAQVHAARGDTAALARIADSAASAGRRSAYGRDRRLHHHIRGLLYSIRGAHVQAAESFRVAEYAPTYSLTQTRYGWGASLLALRRANEAATVLDPLLRRTLTSVGSYFSQAEVHFLLARALAEAGRHQEAREHLAWVSHAWEGADPALQERLDSLRRALPPP